MLFSSISGFQLTFLWIFFNLSIILSSWSQVPSHHRAKFLYKIADLIEKNLEELAVAESRDQGKPVWLAKSVDIPRAALNFRAFAEAISHHLDM